MVPATDRSTRAAVLQALTSRMPAYTGLWTPAAGSAAMALMEIFARDMEVLLRALDDAPRLAFEAFLDTAGVRLLPAQAARAPLVFVLMENSPVDVTLPPGTQVAARSPMPPPSLLSEGSAAPVSPEPVIFTAAQTITLARARLTNLYSIDPDSDASADHSSLLTSAFTLFDEMQQIEHAIYLGHDDLLNLPNAADVILTFGLESPAATVREDFKLAWEYLGADGWRPLDVRATEGLIRDGQVTLRKICGPPSIKAAIFGRTSFWIRGRLTTLLPPAGTDGLGAVPAIDMIRARVGYSERGLAPDAAFVDAFVLDTSGPFRPFGPQPARYTTFYLASRAAFQRKGARLRIDVVMAESGAPSKDNAGKDTTVDLRWEYFAGSWKTLSRVDSDNPFDFDDGTQSFTKAGAITFTCPADWSETNVGGRGNLWLRARIENGDYGRPAHVKDGEIVESTFQPPVIARLTLAYAYLTDPEPVGHVLASNQSIWEDHTQASHWPRETFIPFKPVDDRQPSVYLGFDRRLPLGLVSMYVHVPANDDERTPEAAATTFVWEYFSARGWTELSVLDETHGFRASGMIQFVGQPDAVASGGPGGELYRVRARLKIGERLEARPIGGIWLNAVWSAHGQAFQRESLGTGDGQPGQRFRFAPGRTPVLEGEVVEVREWAGRGGGWEPLLQELPSEDVRCEHDPLTRAVRAVWVRWHARPHLYASGSGDRHYTLDRARGILQFGDGRYAVIPPAGAPVVATYMTGGDLRGNVPIGAIDEIRSAVPYVLSVSNPVPAAGGAATETAESLRARGPQRIKHFGRAVSAADLEWLARESTPVVARARCLSLTGPDGRVQRGWVTLAVAPFSDDREPQPDPEIRLRVREYIAARVPAALARRVRVIAPTYITVSIAADITPTRPDESAQVEARVRQRLNSFLHPLHGGFAGRGWSFGEPVYLSQVARVIENTPGVDFAREARLRVRGQLYADVVPVPSDTLVAPGDHELKLTLAGR